MEQETEIAQLQMQVSHLTSQQALLEQEKRELIESKLDILNRQQLHGGGGVTAT